MTVTDAPRPVDSAYPKHNKRADWLDWLGLFADETGIIHSASLPDIAKAIADNIHALSAVRGEANAWTETELAIMSKLAKYGVLMPDPGEEFDLAQAFEEWVDGFEYECKRQAAVRGEATIARPERVQAAFDIFRDRDRPYTGQKARELFEYIETLEADKSSLWSQLQTAGRHREHADAALDSAVRGEAEPVGWGYWEKLPGRNGRTVLRFVMTKDEADDLRENGLDIFPLYAPPAPAPVGVTEDVVKAVAKALAEPYNHNYKAFLADAERAIQAYLAALAPAKKEAGE